MNNPYPASRGGSLRSAPRVLFLLVSGIIGLAIAGCDDNSTLTHLVAAQEIRAVAEPARQTQVASAAGKYLAGRFARRNRDFNSAARLLTEALRLDKENRRIRRQAFFATVASGRFEEANKLANLIVDGSNGAPISNLTLVVEDVRVKQFKRAAKRLVDMPKRGMNTFTSPLLVAWLHFAGGEVDKAVKALDGLSKVASFVGLRNLHVGLIMDLAGKPVAAEEALKKSAETTQSLRVVQGLWAFSGTQRPCHGSQEALPGFCRQIARLQFPGGGFSTAEIREKTQTARQQYKSRHCRGVFSICRVRWHRAGRPILL